MPSRFDAGRMVEPHFGSWVTLGLEGVVEAMSSLGHDYVGIDCQHSLIDIVTASRLLSCIPLSGPPTVVRTPGLYPDQIGKLLDSGADGVIIPMVNTAEEAELAVASCRYAPRGQRSFGPIRTGLGLDPRLIEERAACFVMIETPTALANLEAICATEGLAGVYVGPADLAVALQLPLGANPPPAQLREAMRRISATARSAGIIAGSHAYSSVHVPSLIEDGFQMMSLSIDRGYMMAAAGQDLATAREAATRSTPVA